MEISEYVLINQKSGLLVFKGYGDFPGVITDSYQLTPQAVNTQSGTTYTLASSDNGKVLVFTNGSAVTVTIPSGFPVGYNCSIVQYGAGQVTVSAGSGVTLRLRTSANKTGGQYAVASLLSVVSNEYLFAGDTSV